jgi:hypothetical protein
MKRLPTPPDRDSETVQPISNLTRSLDFDFEKELRGLTEILGLLF